MRSGPADAPDTAVGVGAVLDARGPAGPVRILLVEDDEDDYLIARDMLGEFESERFDLDWSDDYDDALRRIRLQCHDIYLIDYRLGDRTGLQLMREGFADRPSAPAIMLTGQATHELDLEANALGVTDFLVKQELAPAKLERSIRYAISHQQAERHALAARAANDGIWDWNLEADRIYFSPRWHAILGLEERAHEYASSMWFELVAPEDRHRLREAVDAHLAGHTSHLECEHRMRHADGSLRWVMTSGLLTRSVDGAPVRIAGSLSDMTDQRTAQLRLEHEALHDTLTGLPNRTLFMDRVAHVMHRTSREPDAGCAVLFVDLDGFKQINDKLSHAVGDKLLFSVAQRLQAVLRPGDTVARLGGDEFTLLLDGIDETDGATEIAERVLSAVNEPSVVDTVPLAIGASIGVALSRHALDADQLLGDADLAMYEAKHRGRGRVAVFDERMRRRVADRAARQDELREIIEQSRLGVHFQPIVELATGRIRALEALARWPEDSLPGVAPAELIEIAEEARVIGALGRQVLSRALEALAQWRAEGTVADDVCVSINLSAREFDDADLVRHIREALHHAGLPASALHLEITERTMMSLERSDCLADLCAAGVGFHLDDFGTGHTSLVTLHRLPIRALKVDRSFVGVLLDDPEGEMMVRSTVALAHSLGMPVIAEGIEDAATLERLRELGCDQGQGRLISPALRRSDVPLGRLRSGVGSL